MDERSVAQNKTPKIPEDAIRSPAEVRKMMKEVSWLSKVFSGKHNVKVVALPGEGAWTCGIDHKYAKQIDEYMSGKVESIDDLPPEALVPKLITVRENDFYRDSPREIRRKTRHEAAHAAHSDFKELFKNAKAAKDEGYLPSSYMSAQNGPEDGWVNAMAAGESQAALEDFRQGYDEKLKEILPELPTDPLSRQFGVNAIHYWLNGKDVEGLDPRVIEVTNQVRKSLDKYYSSNSAVENAETFRQEIWPHIRDLEKQDINDEKLRQMAQEAMQNSQGEGGSGQSELGQQIKQELNQNQPGQSQSGGETGEKGDGDSNEHTNSNSQAEPGEESSTGQAKTIDLSKLSPETLEQLKQQIENLSEEEREQLENAARQEIDRQQSEKLNKESPQIIQMEKNEETGEYQPKIQEADDKEVENAEKKLEEFEAQETERERQEMEQARQEEEARQRQQEAMLARQKKLDDMKKEGFEESEEDDYDSYKLLEKEINAEYLELDQEMGRIFPKQVQIVREGYYYSGSPDPRQTARKFPVGDHRFYTRKNIEQSQQVNLTVWLALDISGTMRGSKMHESVKNIIMWSKLTDKYNIPFGIVLFGNGSEVLKNPNQAYSDPTEKIKANLVQKTKFPNQSTNIGAAVETMKEELKNSRRRFPGMQGVALIISDGAPTVGHSGSELITNIEEMQSSFSTFAFGLGSNPDEQAEMRHMLSMYFGEESTIVPSDFSLLPKETARVMNPIMRRLAQRLRY